MDHAEKQRNAIEEDRPTTSSSRDAEPLSNSLSLPTEGRSAPVPSVIIRFGCVVGPETARRNQLRPSLAVNEHSTTSRSCVLSILWVPYGASSNAPSIALQFLLLPGHAGCRLPGAFLMAGTLIVFPLISHRASPPSPTARRPVACPCCGPSIPWGRQRKPRLRVACPHRPASKTASAAMMSRSRLS